MPRPLGWPSEGCCHVQVTVHESRALAGGTPSPQPFPRRAGGAFRPGTLRTRRTRVQRAPGAGAAGPVRRRRGARCGGRSGGDVGGAARRRRPARGGRARAGQADATGRGPAAGPVPARPSARRRGRRVRTRARCARGARTRGGRCPPAETGAARSPATRLKRRVDARCAGLSVRRSLVLCALPVEPVEEPAAEVRPGELGPGDGLAAGAQALDDAAQEHERRLQLPP